MRIKKNKIIQIGGKVLNLPSQVTDKFDYVRLPGNYDFISDQKQTKIFQGNVFNSKLNRHIYVLGQDATLLQNFPGLLVQFPTYQLFFDGAAQINEGQRQILEKKFATPVALESDESLMDTANRFLDLATAQLGYKLSMDHLDVRESFDGRTIKKGNCCLEMSGDFGQQMTQIIAWKMHPHGINANQKLVFMPEINVITGKIELEYRIVLIDQITNDVTGVISGTPESFSKQETIIHNLSANSQFIGLSLYAKGGEGIIEIGQSHFRNYLSDGSMMMPQGKRFMDTKVRNEELFHYFHPGDLKPPLAVYFSGYRSAEGFEGRGMMGRMGCPFILIGDPRLEGGNFYLGSESLEQQVVAVIQEKLEWLGFTNRELILSGLSMGTFGSLYYGTDLEPAAIIIGKPLANIGNIAVNERIKRPEIWGTSLDMVVHFGGKSTISVAQQLNQKFWDKFETGNFDQTIFAIAYMRDDDYDSEAFPMIARCLKEHSSKAKVLYKGFVGRHNDDSPGINTWFLKQYRNILWHNFGRKIDYRV